MEDLVAAEEEGIGWFISALGRSDNLRLMRSLERYWLNNWVIRSQWVIRKIT